MKITIDLRKSLTASQFEDENKIHSNAFTKVIGFVEERLTDARNYKVILGSLSYDNYSRNDNTIAVFGDRGVGKTSFLLSVKDYCVRHPAKAIVTLPVIDPTLIEEKGHVFLLIVSIIDEKVKAVFEEKKKKGECTVEIEHDWNVAKSKLAKGLPSLDKVGLTYEEPQWQEDEYIMTKGMDGVNAAYHLEYNFHKLVSDALKILNKDSFLLLFDDIDVDFHKGWSVLECIRKYLTSPQMIVMLSGNMKLYSTNIRNQQWRNLGKAILINEPQRHVEYTRLVNEIEGQYLLKLLKSEYRIYLYSLADNISLYDMEYDVLDDNGQPINIKKLYESIFNSYGIYGNAALNLFTNFMMSTSARTQMHFLYNAVSNRNATILDSINAFSSRVYAQNIDIEVATNPNQFCFVMLHYLIESEQLEEAYQSLPNFDGTDENSAMSAFSFVFSQLLKKYPFLMFDYWIRICGTRNQNGRLDYQKDSQSSYYAFCRGAGIYQLRDLRSITGNGFAYMASLDENAKIVGTVILKGFAETRKKGKDAFDDRIDVVLNGASHAHKIYGYLPLISLAASRRNIRTQMYSPYALLSDIGELLQTPYDDDNDDATAQTLRELSTPRNYQMFVNDRNNTDVSDTMAAAENNVDFDTDTIKVVANEFKEWAKSYPLTDNAFAPYLFGRVATRVHYAFYSIGEKISKMELGFYMQNCINAIFNAFLVEEMKVKGKGSLSGLNVDNVVTSPKVLNDNIAFVERTENSANIALTNWIRVCPLLKVFTEEGENSLCNTLNKISIRGAINAVKFRMGNFYYRACVDLINDSNLDKEKLSNRNASDEEIKEELEKLFSEVQIQSVKSFRKKLASGKIELIV